MNNLLGSRLKGLNILPTVTNRLLALMLPLTKCVYALWYQTCW